MIDKFIFLVSTRHWYFWIPSGISGLWGTLQHLLPFEIYIASRKDKQYIWQIEEEHGFEETIDSILKAIFEVEYWGFKECRRFWKTQSLIFPPRIWKTVGFNRVGPLWWVCASRLHAYEQRFQVLFKRNRKYKGMVVKCLLAIAKRYHDRYISSI